MRSHILIVSCLILNLTSADSLSVQEIVERTLANNPELSFYEKEIEAAKSDKASSTLLTNPEFETTAGRKTEGTGEGGVWGVDFTQSFEYPGRLKLREAIASRKVAIAELDLEHFKASLVAKTKSTAYQLLYSQQLASVTREISKQGQALIKVLEGREPAGTVPLLEMRIIEANIISLHKKALDAEQAVQSAELDLKELMGNSLAKNITVSNSELALKKLPSLDTLIEQAIATNFELKEQAESLTADGLKIELAKNERVSSFKVGSFYSEENADGTQRIGGLRFSIPLNLWNNNKNAIESAKIKESQTKTSILVSQREVERVVRENYYSYERKLAEIKRWRPKIMTELKDASKLADESFRLGAIPAATYVALQTEYIDSLEAILSLKIEALENLYVLDTYGARSLETINSKNGK